MAKKLSILFLVLVLALSMMVGCQEKADDPAEQPAEVTEEVVEEVVEEAGTVGVLMPTKDLQRWIQDGANMKEQLEAKGYDVDLQYANNDVATQVEQIENMVTKGVDVLVVASIDGGALGNVLAEAHEEGIQVIAYDRLIMDTEACDYYATFDNYKVGTIQGEFIVSTLDLENAEGPFLMEIFAGSPDDNNAGFFNAGAMDVIAPYIESGKLVVVSGQGATKEEWQTVAIQGWKSESAQNRMDNLLTANYADKNIDLVLSPNDSLAQGISASLESSGYGSEDKPFPVLTGQDCDTNSMANIVAGKQSMSIFKDTRTLAARVVTMVDQILAGEEVEVNNTYENNVKTVPSFLCEPVFADATNFEEILAGYYEDAKIAEWKAALAE